MAETKRTLLTRILSMLAPIAMIANRVDLGLSLLGDIDRKLDRLLGHPPVRFRFRFGAPQDRTNLPQGPTQMTTLTDIQHVAVSLEADDAAGNPVAFSFPTPPTWASSDPTVVTVSPSVDGSNADVATTGKLGTAQITVTGTNADGNTVTGIGDVTVITSGATTFKLVFSTPANK